MSDDFRNAPVTIGELRSDRSGKGNDWTPREMLVSLLREIDNGMKVDRIVVCMAQYKGENKIAVQCRIVGDNYLEAMGLLERCKVQIRDDE